MAQAKHIGKVVLTPDRTNGASDGVQIVGDATYLITGGLGALGLRVARWLVDAGARHLVLASRHLPSTTARETIAQLEETGASIYVSQSDVSQETHVSGLMAEIGERLPRLRGVFHAAGVLDDGVLLQQTWPRFEKVLAPKLAGAWHLHRHTSDLDFFVMFSSMVSMFGAPGQGNYAAANACLDALAHHRRSSGLRALSINWGPWEDGGMAATVSERDHLRWRELGVGFIPPGQGLKILGGLLRGNTPPQIAVLPIDWSTMLNRFANGAEPPLFEELKGSYVRRTAPVQPGPKRPALELENVAPHKRRSVVLGFLREEALKVLGLDPAASIECRQPLREFGLDSLMAVELRNAIAEALGRTLPATLLFRHPTLDALCDFVMTQVYGAAVAEAEPAPEPSPSAGTEVDGFETLSDAEAKRLLAEELESLSASGWMSGHGG
jgi:polyketide synthase 12/myxalamid-type polyketide synthase MxaB